MGDSKQGLRYEKKVIIPQWLKEDFIQYLKQHPFFFREHYPQRKVNSIYFDDVGLTDYHHHVAGLPKRKKVRIRWYGTPQAFSPSLEIKKRNGQVGTKERVSLVFAPLGKWIAPQSHLELLQKSDLAGEVRELLVGYKPVLINTYKRQYWLSLNQRFRITLDEDLGFMAFSASNNLDKMFYDKSFMIVEIKYNQKDAAMAFQVMKHFPYRMNRFSKYVFAVKSLF